LSNSNTFGNIKVTSAGGTIVENTAISLAPGSVVTGAMTFTSYGDISTVGTGGSTYQNSLRLNAQGNILISNPISVAAILTVNATGTADLSTLSKTGNLNNLDPVNLGNAAGYTAPSD
jgi:hypothetical protein